MEDRFLSLPIFTLTTDFGLKDSYAAEMKAVILGLCPTAQIIDITHMIEKFNIRSGAYVLASAAPYFPVGTIHIAVVDPDVGSERRALIIQTERGFLVGPDNGLLSLAAEKLGVKHIREITSKHIMPHHVSSTFHGRDIFAPTAAHLANGIPLEELGPEVTNLVRPSFTRTIKETGRIEGEVLHIDNFGNIITNIHENDIEYHKRNTIKIQLQQVKLQLQLSKTYADAKAQQPILLIGSQHYLEIAINHDNAANKLQVKTGDKIILTYS